jgi:hypothetical protein
LSCVFISPFFFFFSSLTWRFFEISIYFLFISLPIGIRGEKKESNQVGNDVTGTIQKSERNKITKKKQENEFQNEMK